MDRGERRGEWAALAGIALIALGVWLIAERLLGPLLEPVRVFVRWVASVGWALALIGLGALLLKRGRRSGDTRFSGRRLYRSRDDRRLGGVLGGLARYLGFDPTLVRVLYAVVTIVTGVWPGVAVYLVALVIVPEEPYGPESGRIEMPDDDGPRVPPAPPIPPAS